MLDIPDDGLTIARSTEDDVEADTFSDEEFLELIVDAEGAINEVISVDDNNSDDGIVDVGATGEGTTGWGTERCVEEGKTDEEKTDDGIADAVCSNEGDESGEDVSTDDGSDEESSTEEGIAREVSTDEDTRDGTTDDGMLEPAVAAEDMATVAVCRDDALESKVGVETKVEETNEETLVDVSDITELSPDGGMAVRKTLVAFAVGSEPESGDEALIAGSTLTDVATIMADEIEVVWTDEFEGTDSAITDGNYKIGRPKEEICIMKC